MRDLVVVDGVTHARIDAFNDMAAEQSQATRCLLDATQWNVRVAVTAADEYRRTFKRPLISLRNDLRPDEARAQSDDRAVAARVARCKFQCETPALREAQQ